ncbi:hypothetical protein W97_03213 [Coniosporium apollinis CBS 100218]|uniref:Dynamin-type G domain-containing protein n=1 Tax=Coniosporium apollinis (strain CBS 100218) TaxID=1168221 RepID=R7YQ59_CONA1|nr:uncharacterized protein W97_03213 [Coniosporium apollinis CBS 100218]EON63983.1 hypothetical protein W97_03213 [Coniosporium apollinis CBS 100218]
MSRNVSPDRDFSSSGPSTPRRAATSGRPQYMTVGSGSTSESAARLVALLDDDSGYGGSIRSGGSNGSSWHPGLTHDRPTPSHTPEVTDRHIHQGYYNRNKTQLLRAINEAVDTLKDFQAFNQDWPAHYPSVQRADPSEPTSSQRSDPRPGLHHTQSTLDNHYEPRGPPPSRPGLARRAGTSLGERGWQPEASSSAARPTAEEPRLVTPQLAQNFLSVLNIDLKMGGLSQAELVHSLEKKSIASLLDGQIRKIRQHLYALRERIEDTSSKVLVTGDLNAGKSTFCNALLRRKVLPVDQQPCTAIFCEVLDARENGGIEEVHAVQIDTQYVRDDERTYDVYALKELENIVTENERYSQCKVYVKDIRMVNESLLNNGDVDIALIDAPGLNADSILTTAVFAKDAEIDVVVFVVSAANRFTQSAKEFIFNAAQEKAYIFMVVNGFDNIRDKKRCQEKILEQLAGLSPATFKESSELVHFVSSSSIPVAPLGGPDGPGGDGSGGSGGSGSGFEVPDGDDDDEPSGKHGEPGSPPGKGKGKEREKIRDFEELEASLRRFVLEKRAQSKLAPARTYLMNVLRDIDSLGTFNRNIAQSEFNRVTEELRTLAPAFEKSKEAETEVSRGTDQTIEETANNVFTHTREHVGSSIARLAEHDFGVQYPGLLSAYSYAEDLKAAMIQEISDSVTRCEQYAREQTSDRVNYIKSLGLLHLGDNYSPQIFRSERMFIKRRDALARQVDFEVETLDFFDMASLWERQEKVAGTGMAVTVAGVVGTRLVGGVGWVDGALGAAKVVGANNLRRLIIPGAILTVILGISYALASIPRSLPRRLSSKLSAQLAELDYTHKNALRISSEVRKALKFPAGELQSELSRNARELRGKKEETSRFRDEAEHALKYFTNLVRKSGRIRNVVENVNLEGPAPGALVV